MHTVHLPTMMCVHTLDLLNLSIIQEVQVHMHIQAGSGEHARLLL